MTVRSTALQRRFFWTLAALAGLVSGGALWWSTHRPPHVADRTADATLDSSAELCPDRPDTLRLPRDVLDRLRIRTGLVSSAPARPPLRLFGSLFLDPNKLAHVRSRFEGEVVSTGTIDDEDADLLPDGTRPQRGLQYGDHVRQGQILSIIWSKEVGEKKSELVDAMVRMHFDKLRFDRLKSLQGGVVADKTIREAERDYELDMIAVERAQRTLTSWQLEESEIDEVRAEAQRLSKGDHQGDANLEQKWAELDIRAPFDGVILEKNIVAGDIIKTDLDLFKIGNLDRLSVLANVYEEDIPTLERIPPAERRWKIQLTAQPDSEPIEGMFDLIGEVIDPKQHTASVRGWVENAAGKMRVGQFINATVDLPLPDVEEVVIPAAALVEDGDHKFVFVVSGPGGNEFTRRAVQVARRARDMVYLSAGDPAQGTTEGQPPLQRGDRVVTSGAVLLTATLAELTISASTQR